MSAELEPVREPDLAALTPTTMPELFRLAVSKGQEGVAILERLVALDERMSARRAAQDFAEAMARFKETCPPVPRRTENTQFKVTRNGTQVPRRYATLEDIEATVRGPLGACGLSFRWGDSTIAGGNMTLQCIVSHAGGHSVTSSVVLPVESRAGCSEAQKYGAVMTYAQRYSLIQALGLTTCDDDTDGASDEPAVPITPEQVEALEALIDQRPAGSRARLLEYLGIDKLEAMPASRFDELKTSLERKIRGQK